MKFDLLTKFLSRKLGIAGLALGIIYAVPSPDPVTAAVKILGTALVAAAYLAAKRGGKPEEPEQ